MPMQDATSGGRPRESFRVDAATRLAVVALVDDAYCGHGAVVAPSVGEGKSEPDCRRGDDWERSAIDPLERPFARRGRLAPRRRGVALARP
jgi:hypothetical protein